MICRTSLGRRRPARDGMTLVELVAALLLAATVLGTALVAYGRSIRQERQARDTLDAVPVADALLADWFAPGGTLPLPEQRQTTPTVGEIEGHENWRWQVNSLPTPIRATAKAPFTVQCYRLEIVATGDSQRPERSLVTVDFVGSIVPVTIGRSAGTTP